ncbi:SRPBCC family protein [Novosphingobium sp.]|uniref:SRPBCC family protein n=1 Tax=Novosphingobium sp. TaxID=1874826 RepID=UPI00286E0DAD|nr:SRPBCC family protein [Novosphingobium sp.]
MRLLPTTLAALPMAIMALPASAEVVASSDAGFVIRLTEEVTATPQESWKMLLTPGEWWSGAHTYSGDARNLYLDAQATGCFCEKLPRPKDAPEDQRNGSVEHMHIVYAEPGRVLRMTGGLGPLQSEALHGSLTMTFKAVPGGTRILWEYVVGGYMRYKPEQIGPAVDKVLTEQFRRLGAKLGAKTPAAPPAKVQDKDEPAPAGEGDAGAVSVGSDVAADFDASLKPVAKPKAAVKPAPKSAPKSATKPAAKKPAGE